MVAEGRYVAMPTALNRVFKKLPVSRRDAAVMIADALKSGALQARGSPLIDTIRPERPFGTLIDLASPHDDVQRVYGKVRPIPTDFWRDSESLDEWDGFTTSFSSVSEHVLVFSDVQVRDKEVNALIAKHLAESDVGTQKVPRARGPDWDQWIAAVAALAYEHQIDGNMKRQDLLERISKRLQTWGVEDMHDTTVGPAARAILARFRSHPPVKPLT